MSQPLDILNSIYGDLLAGRRDEVVDAIVADGWPRAMVEEGLELHAKTWTPVDILRSYEAEIAAAGLPRNPPGVPGDVLHIWPKLPGAGVTPVFYGIMLGVPSQRIRASRQGRHFAEVFVSIAAQYAPGRIVFDQEHELDAEVVVVSGSDETLAAVALEMSNQGGLSKLIGYGHRVSFAVVEGSARVADRVAEDIVMWHQYGCFSARAVVVVGTADQADRFADELAPAIASVEERLGATELPDDVLANRAQALGLAEFRGPVRKAKIGWVERRAGIPDGEWIAPHVAVVHDVQTINDVDFAIGPDQLQGLAVAGSAEFVSRMTSRAEQLGATRVCRVGELQAPPASWPHDGRPNVVGWLLEDS